MLGASFSEGGKDLFESQKVTLIPIGSKFVEAVVQILKPRQSTGVKMPLDVEVVIDTRENIRSLQIAQGWEVKELRVQLISWHIWQIELKVLIFKQRHILNEVRSLRGHQVLVCRHLIEVEPHRGKACLVNDREIGHVCKPG